ncbi:MAG: hypothetical protein HWD86_10420 [Kangiellaceae bacterium]|nr:hypothetical protein [Kangiellaceae bacterium]
MGNLHFASAILALTFGSLVLLQKKATRFHRKIGMAYVVSMSFMLLTSFMTYRLYGRFGTFHYMSVFATIVLAVGMLPMWFKRPRNNYKLLHINFMYWSVIGLYMALFSEVFTRIPETPFYKMVFWASLGVLVLGFVGHWMFFPKWRQRFNVYKAGNHG